MSTDERDINARGQTGFDVKMKNYHSECEKVRDLPCDTKAGSMPALVNIESVEKIGIFISTNHKLLHELEAVVIDKYYFVWRLFRIPLETF